jgi:starch phosphorylase
MPLSPFIQRTHIAYFSMEIAIRAEMHTYSGGLGVLAGDTARACADLEMPAVFITLISRAGYFRQEIAADGNQIEQPDLWEPSKWCAPLDAMVAVEIEGRHVWIRPWLYILKGPYGHNVPILLLDTDLDQNSDEDRNLTHFLYGDGETYRLKQEIVLGLGGFRLLRALGFDIHTYHLNEGHAALLALELLNRYRIPPEEVEPGESIFELAEVRERCAFTTHTPVEAGHDQFSYDLFERLMPNFVVLSELKRLAGHDRLNMTQLALNLAGYINGVARRHAQTSEHLFPGHDIHAITNGIHVQQWAHDAFARLYQDNFPHWCHEPEILIRTLQLPNDDVWRCHQAAKADLVAQVKQIADISFDPNRPIIGFARRMTGYKRPLLLFHDLERLTAIASRYPFQVVMAGKAHPKDFTGKDAIYRIHRIIDQLRGKIVCAFLPNYDMDIAKTMVSGADIWLNTPLPPLEASGTSGMKAALNGALNLSVLDGWWVEGCIEGVTGWSIGPDASDRSDEQHAAALYDKLAESVLPLYYDHPDRWRTMMKQSISNIASYFNSQRMMRRYATEAYLR